MMKFIAFGPFNTEWDSTTVAVILLNAQKYLDSFFSFLFSSFIFFIFSMY